MKIYKKRNEIPSQFRWDLKSILVNKEPQFYFNKIKRIAKYLTKNKETYLESKTQFYEYLKKTDELLKNKFIYENYLSNNISINITNSEIREKSNEYSFWNYKFAQDHATSTNFIIKNKKKIKMYLLNNQFKPYRDSFSHIFDSSKHLLSDIEEKLISQLSRGFTDVENQFSILSNTELIYNDVIDENGKMHKLTQGNYHVLMKSLDPTLRKNTYNEFWNRHLDHKESFATMLYEHKKCESTIALLRKYKSTINMLIYDDYVDDKLLQNIYSIVSQKSHLVHKFTKLWKKNYYLKFNQKPKIYDLSVELLSFDKKYTISEAQKIVKKALEPFGSEYLTMIQKAFDNRWIDYLPHKNKRSGAYSIGSTYGIEKKYICMNFDETYRSVETLAHELGHSMHSYYSDKNNHIAESQYEILVAEIASTFNELLLGDYMITHSTSSKEKLFIIEKLIEGIIGAIHRQAMWSEYEYNFYKMLDVGKPINTHKLQMELYCKILNKYSGKKTKVIEHKSTKSSSFYVPHYYYGFYVYKYVVGLAAAYIFFDNYKKEGKTALEKYVKEFLSAGGKGKPINRLKKAGVDLEDPKTVEKVFDILEKYLKEYSKLSKEVFGVKNELSNKK